VPRKSQGFSENGARIMWIAKFNKKKFAEQFNVIRNYINTMQSIYIVGAIKKKKICSCYLFAGNYTKSFSIHSSWLSQTSFNYAN